MGAQLKKKPTEDKNQHELHYLNIYIPEHILATANTRHLVE